MDELTTLDQHTLRRLNLQSNGDQWRIVWPDDTNIFHMTVGKFLNAESRDTTAMIFEESDGTVATMTFADVDTASTNLASALQNLGYGRGDLIGLHTGQHPDTAVAHMAVCKLGGVAVTLSQLYGPQSLQHALNDCKLKVLLTSEDAWGSLRTDAAKLFPHLEHVLLRNPSTGEIDLRAALTNTSAQSFTPDFVGANDPALLMYTSGSTGKPKGILHGHRILAAYTPSINLFFDLAMEKTDAVYWSPSDWAWVGGLLDMLFPAWMAGRPIATSLHRFNAEYAYQFLQRHKVTHTFLAPTAIKRLAHGYICTGGEALASETLNWAENSLGVVCNEFYGLTEVNHLIGNCASLYPRIPGSMGRAYPGHSVYLVDSDANGYFWYKGRSDDLIKSSGFRIGPAEIEECLLAHGSVAEVAIVAKPDAERGSIVKAFIKLRAGEQQSDAMVESLCNHVRTQLAGYKTPREVEFVNDFVSKRFPALDPKLYFDRLALPQSQPRVLIDTDAANEIDDQFAIAWALMSPEHMTVEAGGFQGWLKRLHSSGRRAEDLEFVSPAEGMELSYQEILTVYEKLGMASQGKVFRGAQHYMSEPDTIVDSESVDTIIDLAKSGSQPLYIAAMGCVTNIASALLRAPEIRENIVVIWTSAYPSSSPQCNRPSLNLVQDVHASRIMFDSGVPAIKNIVTRG